MKPTTIIHPVFAALMTVGLAACQIDESLDPGIDQEFRTSFGCGPCNSPRVNDAEVGDLDLNGDPNAAGIVLLGIIDPSTQTMYDVEVDPLNHELRVQVGQSYVNGMLLAGWELLVQDKDEKEYRLIINVVDYWPTWSNLYINDTVVYSISYFQEDAFVSLCPTEDVDAQFVTIIAGETYDRDSIEVNPNQAQRFTLACVKEAAFKMKMLGYYPNSLEADDPDLRQATLKMLTADYCGLGIAFTDPETPLDWLNDGGFDVPQWNTPPDPDDFEAIWDKDGAVCLKNPRVVDYEDIEEACGAAMPPFCSEQYLQMPHEWTTWIVP